MSETIDELSGNSGTQPAQSEEISSLRDVLVDWINTSTWNEALSFLKTHAEQLLSDEAFQTLDQLIHENTDEGDEAEQKALILQQHRALLSTIKQSFWK